MSAYLFNCGLPKTGTVSMHKALEILGIKSLHSVNVGRGITRWCREHRCNPVQMPPKMRKYVAFGDGPLWRVTLPLLRNLPDCRVIATVRDKDSWINSPLIHVLANRVGTAHGTWKKVSVAALEKDYDSAQEIYRKAEQRFRSRFLLFNFSVGDGWEKICHFLGHQIPEVEFPRENTSIEKLEAMLAKLKSERATVNAVPEFAQATEFDRKVSVSTEDKIH